MKVLMHFLINIFIILRAIALLNVITTFSKNEYISFFLYIIFINQGESIAKAITSLFYKVNGISEFSIQTQVKGVFNINLDTGKVIQIVFVNLCVCVFYNCIAMLIYKYKDIRC